MIKSARISVWWKASEKQKKNDEINETGNRCVSRTTNWSSVGTVQTRAQVGSAPNGPRKKGDPIRVKELLDYKQQVMLDLVCRWRARESRLVGLSGNWKGRQKRTARRGPVWSDLLLVPFVVLPLGWSVGEIEPKSRSCVGTGVPLRMRLLIKVLTTQTNKQTNKQTAWPPWSTSPLRRSNWLGFNHLLYT